ncbi:MAG TPA: hypothetical protein VN881_00735 [Candidatus Acidoferrales bacterium]|jgi:hypothetical protein|nr:hypothetical protein [Candidatus Acidoferrales bacterium]
MTKHFRGLRRTTVAMFAGAALMLVSPAIFTSHTRAAAQDAKAVITERTTVLTHIPVPGSAVRQMFLQEENGKRYLYLQQNVHFTVVDVTDPKNPKIVERAAVGGRLQEVGSGLAIAIQSNSSGQGTVPTQSVRLLDLTDPKNPRTVKSFEGVTSIYSEDGRKLIYLANNDGLWVVKHSESHPLPMCDSESWENTVSQCQ